MLPAGPCKQRYDTKMYQAAELETDASLVEARWPDGPVCPYCRAGQRVYVLGRRASAMGVQRTSSQRWKCGVCRRVFSQTTGTLLGATKLPLTEWLRALALVCESPEGLSAKELSTSLGVTRKSALAMLRRLRWAAAAPGLQRTWRSAARKWRTAAGGGASELQQYTIRKILRGKPLAAEARRYPGHGALPGNQPESFRVSLWPLTARELLEALLRLRPE